MNSCKSQIRDAAVQLLKQLDFKGKERMVRINEFDSPFFKDDVEAILPARPDAIRIPKCETVKPILELNRRVSEFENANNLQNGSIEFVLLIETPAGVRNAYELASCCERVTAVGIGMEDLTSEMLMQRYYEPFSDDLIYVRQKLVLDVKAAKKQVIDSMSWWPMPEDEYIQYQKDYSRRSYRMGYDGRSCRDGRDAKIANESYAPTEEQITWGRQAVKAYEDSERTGTTPLVNGKNICAARYHKAKWFVEYSDLLKERRNRKEKYGGMKR